MGDVLAFAESREGSLHPAARETVSAARSLAEQPSDDLDRVLKAIMDESLEGFRDMIAAQDGDAIHWAFRDARAARNRYLGWLESRKDE